jgi:Tol biopolymer transport system component
MTLEQGDLLYNRYRILDILGRGGMGSVFHAIDESLGVEVAVKENLFVTEEYEQQFKLEAVILASLRHPNLPRVTDHFTIEGQGQYLVMDYIEGRDLRHLMETGPISEAETIRIGVAVCEALTYLHTRKHPVLHRDLKPGNVRIAPDGQVYLVDFGLAKMSDVGEHTLSGARAMTPGYSPPEQYGTSRTDARTDIYSLGATLYAALTGFIPEDGLARVVDEVQLTPLRKRNPKVSKELADVVEKAMEPHAHNRYQSAEDFRRALLGMEPAPAGAQAALEVPSQPPSNTTPPGVVEKTPTERPTPRKTSGFAWIVLVAMLALFALGAFWMINNPESAPAPFQGLLSLIISPTSTSAASPTVAHIPTSTSAPVDAKTLTTIGTHPAITATATPMEPPEETPSPSPIPAKTTAPIVIGGGKGEIAFASMRNGGISQIYLINADGSNLRTLTTETNGACQPAWSPDGKKLVYVSPCAGKNDQYPKSSLFMLDLDSGAATQLLKVPGGDFEPAWSPSPDGMKIAFSSLREGFLAIYVLNRADQVVTRLTDLSSTIQSRQPAWSLPDGKQIAYTVKRSGILRIWTMLSDGTNQTQLPRNNGSASDYLPAWSPDGSYILFSEANSTITSPSSLVRFILNSDQSPQILPIPLPVVDANFSPNGQWIAYETSDTINQDIFIYNLLKNDRQRLTADPAIDFDPAWRP